jgi:SAM-dependent methyltransferase
MASSFGQLHLMGTASTMLDARIAYTACPLCQHTAIDEYRRANCAQHPLYQAALPSLMRWLRCSACQHVFTDGYWSPAALELIFASANPHQLPGNSPHGSRAIAARMVEKVIQQLGTVAGHWLDIGFGNGALLGAAEEYGFAVAGLDMRAQAVQLMRADGIEAQCLSFIDYLPPQPLRVISMADVLEHIPLPGPVLQHAHRALSDNGLLFLSMPNSDCYAWRMLDRQNANPYWGELEHYHNFGRRRLSALLEQYGFQPIAYGISERYYLCMEIIARKTHRST